MSRFLSGLIMVLFVIVVDVLVAFIISGTGGTTTIAGCTSNTNATACQTVGGTTFLASLAQTTITGIDALPAPLSFLYPILMDGILIGGIILMALAFGPTLGY